MWVARCLPGTDHRDGPAEDRTRYHPGSEGVALPAELPRSRLPNNLPLPATAPQPLDHNTSCGCLQDGAVTDVYGIPFPKAEQNITVEHRVRPCRAGQGKGGV